MKNITTLSVDENEFYQTLRSYVVEAQRKIYTAVNDAMVTAYWKIGRDISCSLWRERSSSVWQEIIENYVD